MNDRDALYNEVRVRLEANGQRFTANHRGVIEVLADAGQPLTIPQILRRSHDLPQSSVYRTMAILEKVNVVRRLLLGTDHAHFELSEDLGHHHHHLVCRSCDVVIDVVFGAKIETAIDDALIGLADGHGFRIESHNFDAYGYCATCA